MRTYLITAMDASTGQTEYLEYTASSLAEALTMAERADAGTRERIYGIAPADYAIADAEGIQYNTADGLLI